MCFKHNTKHHSHNNYNDILIALLLFASCFLIAFMAIGFAKTVFNYQQTSSDYSQIGNDLMPNLGPISLAAIIIVSLCLFIFLEAIKNGVAVGIFSFLYEHRFAVGAVIILTATIFELSGSSIACMSAFLGEGSSQGTLFGIPRSIRSDEWLVFTPFAFSQEAISYAPVSDLLRGTSTNVNLVYAQPCWDFSTFFRPFLWGYLLLGSTRGLAFFWSSRLVCLFLTSEAFAQIVLGKKRAVSTAFALMVTFSSTVQWWFAVNGTAELFIFGQLLVICLEGLLRINSYPKAWRAQITVALSFSIAWLCVAFILILYPAWQVTLFWVFLSVGISRIVIFAKEGHETAEILSKIKPLLISLIITVIAIGICFIPVIDIVKVVSETVYPGSRVINGGGFNPVQLGDWARAIFSPLAASAQSTYAYTSFFSTNVCESSVFFAATPLGCCVALMSCARARLKKEPLDPTLCSLSVVEAFLLFYCVVGLPAPIASITLLSHSGVTRCWEMIGYIDLILMLRWSALTYRKPKNSTKRQQVFLTLAIAVLCIAWSISAENVRLLFTIGAGAAMTCLLASMVLMRLEVVGSDLCFFTIAVFVAISGACVNPLQYGAYALTQGPTATAISQSNNSNDLWIADNSILGDLCVSEGASCINSVNTYPSLSTWHTVDPDGKYEEVYNRYAHITVEPTYGKTSFELMSPDSFKLFISLDELRKLGVTKWISSKNLSDYSTDTTEAIAEETTGGYTIWRLVNVD